MTVFGNYSRYYDLLYKDKDYQAETAYVDGLIKKFGNAPATLLELGCGTGRHAALFADSGYWVTGIDQSAEMLAVAGKYPSKSKPTFLQGDIRTFRTSQTFAAAISLFHVISYQTTNEDVVAALSTAAAHLSSGGIFVFDVWYLPAVLTDRPSVRIKRLEDETIKVTRLAEPTLHASQNIVNVNYEVIIETKATGALERLNESHQMRYFSTPEIEFFLARSGFSLLHSEEWLSGKKPGFDTWGVCFVAQKI